MIDVLGHPYIDLDNFLDIDNLEKITDDILLGIAKSRSSAGPTNSGTGYIDKTKKSTAEIYREIVADPSHPYYNIIKSLKNWEPYTFIQYKWPSHVLGQCILLRTSGNNNYDKKDSVLDCYDLPAKRYFDSFISWLDKQNIFEGVGRIVIFLNDPYGKTIEHRDYDDGVSRKDNFIWINPLGRKKFYIRDEYGKHYVTSKTCFFDSANIHGSEPTDTSTFSIRVDGIFSQQFKQITGLKDYCND